MSLDHPHAFVKRQTDTSDAFLDGRLTLVQPQRGFRAGQDAVLLGAATAPGFARLADLGAGAGAAGLVALAHADAPQSALFAEADPAMCEYCAHNIALNNFAALARTAHVDVTAPGPVRQTAGLVPDHFDCVIANPPYFAAEAGTRAPDAQRAAARHMAPDDLDRWVRTAAAIAAPGGEIIFIFPAVGLPALLAAFAARFGALTLLPIQSRPGQSASRVLLRGIKASRSPFALLPPLVLHGATGNGFSPAAEAIFRGHTRLDWSNGHPVPK